MEANSKLEEALTSNIFSDVNSFFWKLSKYDFSHLKSSKMTANVIKYDLARTASISTVRRTLSLDSLLNPHIMLGFRGKNLFEMGN